MKKLTAETIKHLIPVWVVGSGAPCGETCGKEEFVDYEVFNPKSWKQSKKCLAKTELKTFDIKSSIEDFCQDALGGGFYKEIFDKIENWDRCIFRSFKTKNLNFAEIITTPEDDKIVCWAVF